MYSKRINELYGSSTMWGEEMLEFSKLNAIKLDNFECNVKGVPIKMILLVFFYFFIFI